MVGVMQKDAKDAKEPFKVLAMEWNVRDFGRASKPGGSNYNNNIVNFKSLSCTNVLFKLEMKAEQNKIKIELLD